jgi:hypothetical protein
MLQHILSQIARWNVHKQVVNFVYIINILYFVLTQSKKKGKERVEKLNVKEEMLEKLDADRKAWREKMATMREERSQKRKPPKQKQELSKQGRKPFKKGWTPGTRRWWPNLNPTPKK